MKTTMKEKARAKRPKEDRNTRILIVEKERARHVLEVTEQQSQQENHRNEEVYKQASVASREEQLNRCVQEVDHNDLLIDQTERDIRGCPLGSPKESVGRSTRRGNSQICPNTRNGGKRATHTW